MNDIPHCTGCGEYPGDLVADRIKKLEKRLEDERSHDERWMKFLYEDLRAIEKDLDLAHDFIRRLERFAIECDDKFLIARSKEILAQLKWRKNDHPNS